jgi:cation diffusion facilitator family transporter
MQRNNPVTSWEAEKSRVAMVSVFAAVVITATKVIVGVLTNSLGILAEAAHSGLDLVAAFITLLAVRVADRPADADHHYGHSKIENFSALIETVILLVTCGWIVYEAVKRLVGDAVHVEVTVWSFAVMAFSIVVDYWRAGALMRVAKKYNSQALEADALHFSTDIYSSAVVIAGLIGAYFGIVVADVIAALVVALIVIYISSRLIRRTFDVLIDKSPEGLREKILELVIGQPGILGCRSLRVRQSGMYNFCDMVVAVDRRMPFDMVHSVIDRLEDKIGECLPHIDLNVHAEPEASPAESLLDQVRMEVIKLGFLPHEIEIFDLENGERLVDLHVEWKWATSFYEAHRGASLIEAALKRNFPEVGLVAVHLEEEREGIERYRELTESNPTMVRGIADVAEKFKEVISCTGVKVFERDGRCKAVMNVLLDGSLALAEVHRIATDVERGVLEAFPKLGRVVIHSEPAGPACPVKSR